MSLSRTGRPVVRCAIYTRKSTTEGLDSDFNTLDAQREACEHYVQSQASQGWELLPRRYDDGGFTGSNIDRPALARLLADVERGEVDEVVVYKVDRLSRSLRDFGRLMERFERHKVGFAAVTQQFDTSTSMGRLVLNVLLSFAQFERELISERTRDKIQAARRRGKWTGGQPILGYDLRPEGGGLRLVEEEAKFVRLVFEVYAQTRSLDATAEQLNMLGLSQKRYETRKGVKRGGGPWTRNAVHTVLRNPLYVGKVRGHGGSLHAGQQESIVEEATFADAARRLNGRTTARKRPTLRSEYLLAGLLSCGPCGSPMRPSSAKGRDRVYRYYRCAQHQRRVGRCSRGQVSAVSIEEGVLAQAMEFARREEMREVLGSRRHGRPRKSDDRLASIGTTSGSLSEVCSVLMPQERARIVRLLVRQVSVDGEAVRITFCELPAETPGAVPLGTAS